MCLPLTIQLWQVSTEVRVGPQGFSCVPWDGVSGPFFPNFNPYIVWPEGGHGPTSRSGTSVHAVNYNASNSCAGCSDASASVNMISSFNATFRRLVDDFGEVYTIANKFLYYSIVGKNKYNDCNWPAPVEDQWGDQGNYMVAILPRKKCEPITVTQAGSLPGVIFSTTCGSGPLAGFAYGDMQCNKKAECNKIIDQGKSQYKSTEACGDGANNFNSTYGMSTTVSNGGSPTTNQAGSLAQEAIDKKFDILLKNQPQNCQGDKCGESEDDCWGLWNILTWPYGPNDLSNNEAEVVKFKSALRVSAVQKELEDLKIKSIVGKFYLYKYDWANPLTPCCNKDSFNGTIFYTIPFNIINGETKTFKRVFSLQIQSYF